MNSRIRSRVIFPSVCRWWRQPLRSLRRPENVRADWRRSCGRAVHRRRFWWTSCLWRPAWRNWTPIRRHQARRKSRNRRPCRPQQRPKRKTKPPPPSGNWKRWRTAPIGLFRCCCCSDAASAFHSSSSLDGRRWSSEICELRLEFQWEWAFITVDPINLFRKKKMQMSVHCHSRPTKKLGENQQNFQTTKQKIFPAQKVSCGLDGRRATDSRCSCNTGTWRPQKIFFWPPEGAGGAAERGRPQRRLAAATRVNHRFIEGRLVVEIEKEKLNFKKIQFILAEIELIRTDRVYSF